MQYSNFYINTLNNNFYIIEPQEYVTYPIIKAKEIQEKENY